MKSFWPDIQFKLHLVQTVTPSPFFLYLILTCLNNAFHTPGAAYTQKQIVYRKINIKNFLPWSSVEPSGCSVSSWSCCCCCCCCFFGFLVPYLTGLLTPSCSCWLSAGMSIKPTKRYNVLEIHHYFPTIPWDHSFYQHSLIGGAHTCLHKNVSFKRPSLTLTCAYLAFS